jgi:cobaltochelatase CobS
MDRWSIVTTLNYLPHDEEVDIVLSKAPHYRSPEGAISLAGWCGSPT